MYVCGKNELTLSVTENDRGGPASDACFGGDVFTHHTAFYHHQTDILPKLSLS
jgi:hypothetical protein